MKPAVFHLPYRVTVLSTPCLNHAQRLPLPAKTSMKNGSTGSVTESSSKILISACLLGQPVRYDGQSKHIDNATLELWKSEGLLVPVCPEVSGGLPVPRPAGEIQGIAETC